MNAMRGLTSADDRTSPKFAFISAATSKENAFEHFAEGKDHGSLTYFLARQLRAAGAGATYRDVMDSVIGNVTANYPTQHPSLEGVEADQHVFGDGTSLAGTYVPASPSQLDAKRATLNIGQVQGATVGSTYDVYPPGSKKFAPPERPDCEITACIGRRLQRGRGDPPGWKGRSSIESRRESASVWCFTSQGVSWRSG